MLTVVETMPGKAALSQATAPVYNGLLQNSVSVDAQYFQQQTTECKYTTHTHPAAGYECAFERQMCFVSNKLLKNATHSDPRQPFCLGEKKKCKGVKLTSHPMRLTNAARRERGRKEEIYFDAAAKTTHAFIYVSPEVGKSAPPVTQEKK